MEGAHQYTNKCHQRTDENLCWCAGGCCCFPKAHRCPDCGYGLEEAKDKLDALWDAMAASKQRKLDEAREDGAAAAAADP